MKIESCLRNHKNHRFHYENGGFYGLQSRIYILRIFPVVWAASFCAVVVTWA